MVKAFDYVKRQLVNFKLNMCCWMAPVKIGLIIIGYLNIISAVVSLVALSDDSYTPLLMQVQATVLEDNAKKPIPVIVYSAELVFNTILLTAIFKKDIPLLRFYQRYCLVAIVSSILFYSLVVGVVGLIVGLALVVSILLQIYVLILVRSLIVEFKQEIKLLELPTVVMSTINEDTKEVKIVSDVEAPSDSESDDDDDSETDSKDKLETVDEHPKESNSEEEKQKK